MGSLLLAAAMQQSKTPGEPMPPLDTSGFTAMRQIVNNTGWHRTAARAGQRGAHVITRHEVRTPAKSLRMHYGLHGWAGLDDGLAAKWSLVIDGAIHPVLWDGQHEAFIPQSAAGRTSDPLSESVVVRAGQVIYSVMEIAPNAVYPAGEFKQPSPVSARINDTFVSIPGQMTSHALSGAPVGLYGLTDPTEVLSAAHLGDSFSEPGWGRNALEHYGFAWSDMSQWAERSPTGIPDRRFPATGPLPYRFVMSAYSGNDRGQPLAEQQRLGIMHWYALKNRGARVACTTLHPYTYSTDGWSTIEGQTPQMGDASDPTTSEYVRIERNNWLRDGAPLNPETREPGPTGTMDASFVRIGHADHPLAFPVFDQAAATAPDPDSSYWRIDGGAWTADGTHLTQHGSDMLQKPYEQWVADNLT